MMNMRLVRELTSRTSCFFLIFIGLSEANMSDLESMLSKIEKDTSTFAHKMEELIMRKCNYTSDDSCFKGSFDRCNSEFPNATCPGKEYAIQRCGKGNEGGCGGLFDFTTSVVTVAPDNSDPYFYQEGEKDRVKDDVCSTLRLEQYMKDATDDSKSYWESYDVFPPWMYFGTDDGVFRKFPASPGKCPNGRNDYDPRVRPWYVAASSGPKDVVLVLDTSRSMKDYGRLDNMKSAAKRVVNTLGVGDYFSVIQFSNNATIVGDDMLMLQASDNNKRKMVKEVDSLSAEGGTFFKKGFKLAFETLNNSLLQDRSSGCHRAILFLTDGQASDSKIDILTEIETERNKFINRGQSPPVMFTYSFGAGADDNVPYDIACANDGIWAKINDRENLAKSMGAYYKYFAYGLGDKTNEDFVAWVEPYAFSTAVGKGTTASAPVFDRTVDPPVLAGVVGMDISFAALQRAFGRLGDSETDVIASIVQRSGAVCPKVELTPCQLESLRKFGSNDNGYEIATCGSCTSSVPSLKAPLCPTHATELWNNTLNKGRTYEERACCTVGSEPRTMGSMTSEEIKIGVCQEGLALSPSIGLIIGAVIAVVIIGMVVRLFIRRRRKLQKNPYISNSQNNHSSQFQVPEQANHASIQELPIASFDNQLVAVPVPYAKPVVAVPVIQ